MEAPKYAGEGQTFGIGTNRWGNGILTGWVLLGQIFTFQSFKIYYPIHNILPNASIHSSSLKVL
jgi:hypothetical protein